MAVFQKILAGTCELTTSAFTPVTTMPIFTGDDNGAVISVSFTEDGDAYTIPLDVDVKAYLFYDAKNTMTEAYTMTVDGDTASLDVPDAFTAVSGNPQCIIMMIDGDANVTKVCAFSLPVKRTTSDTIIYLAPPSPDTIVYIGRAPYVCELGTWCVWDNNTRQYVDSGISAAGNYTVFVKWSAINPTQDSDMSNTPNAWMGIYTGQFVTAPTTYTSYRWYKVKGEKGDDGASAYVHIRWGTSATPETLLTDPDAYIGIASTSSATAPADYTGYSWYLYKGAQGDPGDAGVSAYVHIRWGTSLTPATLLTVPDEYIGIASTSSATAPADYTGYAWYKYKGEPGETVTVVDSLTSDSTTSALSAAQGKALNLAKAAKAASPTSGHIATLDSDGNPVDSTKSFSDLATSAQGGLADTAVQPATIAMITGGGVFSGGAVTAQATPDQTVAVAAVSYITDDGKRYSLSAVASLAAAAADATNPRIDIVYGSGSGVITYLSGTAAGSPAQPATPTHGVLLASITRAANDNTIATGDITDKRTYITTRLTKGTWTPVVSAVSGSITSYTVNQAVYRISDDIVTIFVSVTITDKGTGIGGFYLTLPFAASGVSTAYGREQAATGKMLQGYLSGSSALVLDYANGDPIATNGLYIVAGSYIKS